MTHYIYLVRPGEHLDAEHGLSDGPLSPRGRRQASLLAERLSGVPFEAVWHSPLDRTTETARVIAERMPSVSPQPSSLLFDCVPTGMHEEAPAVFEPYFGSVTEEEVEAGRAQMADAVNAFLVRKTGDIHELLITHNFVISWFVREVLQAPEWKWMTLNQANCAITVLSQRPGRPWSLYSYNDVAHLPVEMRTGLPEPYGF
ncbi:histidine phosphatase family protein [Microbacterium sediminicola]|uniref:Histidine phosphatase family protein n=1 Tax=Microbacterium sediminicola TaxID=415210 RepID=A0ABP4TZM4_9MICO